MIMGPGDKPLVNRAPLATYRLQFNRRFKFSEANALIEYLKDLGISDLYASPLFPAGPESTHGYDVCSFERHNQNVGTAEEFTQLTSSLRAQGMGLLLDMVPNHMGTHPGNRWWYDVLRNGERSQFATFFDLNWSACEGRKVLLPVLGDRYDEVLRRGELQLVEVENQVTLSYFDKRFPLRPESLAELHGCSLPAINSDHEKLNQVIQRQHYRLAFWRVGPHEINYRRFFDVTELVSVRIEDQHVFDATHYFLFDLLKNDVVTGIRIDHPDGLYDPKTYFDRLQQRFRSLGRTESLYVVAEKILSDGEQLPRDWAVSGTTGYDYLNCLNGVFVAQSSEPDFSAIYAEFSGIREDYQAIACRSKQELLRKLFPSELNALTRRLRKIAQQTIDGIDFLWEELRNAIVEFISFFPVYRTYTQVGTAQLPPQEKSYVDDTLRRAAEHSAVLAPALKFLTSILNLDRCSAATEAFRTECVEFVLRFQQVSGPATAKGLEDTAFYRYVRLVSLNEVGGNPGNFGFDLNQFHLHNARQQKNWPHTLLATATHDTKRGEDVRARLNVLSEIPGEWRWQLWEWREINQQFKTRVNDLLAPTANDEYLLYQILVGSWTGESPLDLEVYCQRIQQYMEKATREAKLHTSWTDPNPEYEKATSTFVRGILQSEKFRPSFESFQKRVAYFGIFNSLAQVLVKSCSPGVPDFYQGTEFWDYNLVDPDNRRPVDYEARKRALSEIKVNAAGDRSTYLRTLLAHPERPELKMFLVSTALEIRNRNPAVFQSGEYIPLGVRGAKREHVVAFARKHGENCVVVVVPRLPALLSGGTLTAPMANLWGDTEVDLPQSNSWQDAFTLHTTKTSRVTDLLSDFPVALLHNA